MTQEGREDADVATEGKRDVVKNQEKARRSYAFKIVIRRLPPSMSENDFLEQVSPLPEYDSYYFTCADSSMSGNSFARAYISLRSQQDILQFKEKWDGYVFLDERGQEYPAIVEFAPFQKMPRKKPKKADSLSGTLADDPEYLEFLETMDVEEDIELPSMETTVEELERRDRELKANNGVPNVLTPLIEFVLAKKMEKFRLKEEKREEKRKKEAERKKKTEEKRRQKKLFTAAKINKDGVLREESEEEANVVSEDEPRSESQKKDKARIQKGQNRTPKPRQSPANRDRFYDDEPGYSGRQRGGRNFQDRDGNNRPTKHPDDETKPLRRNSRVNDSEEPYDEERPPTRRERRGLKNADRERNNDREKNLDKEKNVNHASISKDSSNVQQGEPSDHKPSEPAAKRPDRPERKDKPPRRERQGDKKPRPPRKDDRQQAKKDPPPKPQSKRYSDIRPGAQERQQMAMEESRESSFSNEGENGAQSKSRNHHKDQRNSKVRNRDRPTMEIYRPGQRRKSDNSDDRNAPN